MEFRDVAQIVTFAGLVAFGGWEFLYQEKDLDIALNQVELAHQGITAKQVQLCTNHSKAFAETVPGFVPVSQERCEQLVKDWQEAKPVPPQYERLLAGWAFGGYDSPSTN